MKIVRYFLIFALISYQFAVCQNSVQIEINKLAKNSTLSNASISFLAIDLDSNQSIAALNPDLSLPTASTAKLFSTATSLKVLGPKFQPLTKFYLNGDLDSLGKLNGDLWIRGGGDPSLGSRFFTEKGHEADFIQAWIDTLKKLGINAINGNVIIDGSDYSYQGIPDGWSWSDMGNYYGAGPSGIVLFDNMVQYHFKTSQMAGQKTQLTSTFPVVEKLLFDNQIVSSNKSGDNSYIYGAPYSYDRFGVGSLPVQKNDFIVKGSLPDPELQLANELRSAFTNTGLHSTNQFLSFRSIKNNQSRDYSKFKLIYEHKGETIASIVNETNLHSINLFAEQLLFLCSKEKYGYGSTENGIRLIEKSWAKDINFSGLNITDGSGLSRSNAISANHFCQLLKGIYTSEIYTDFLSSLPIAGCSGTLTNVCKNQLGHGRIKAKSGTLNRVKSYVGYVDSKSGKKIAFAIIVNNYNCSSSQLVDLMEHVFNAMAEF